MKEKDIQTILSKVHRMHGVFELKLCKTGSIRFDAVKEHQAEALLSAKRRGGLFHKITDFPMFAGSKVRFNRPKPFDFFYLSNTPAFVIICFYVPRKRKTCYYVDIDAWCNKEKTSEKKSIREEEIRELSVYIQELDRAQIRKGLDNEV